MLSWKEAEENLVGGVNSPVRAFRAMNCEPFFVESSAGCKIKDTLGNERIDFVMSWGALIAGHANPRVVEAVTKAAQKGMSYGAATEQEVILAGEVKKAFPSIDKIRLVSSGTEAVMSAIRLARGFTQRKQIIKFTGCYHGHSDSLLVKAGSGAATFGVPDSAGVPEEIASLTINITYNDLDSVNEYMKKHGADVACIIVEPIACNMGLVLPEQNFLFGLRKVCDQHGALLIFDEVITGFRIALGGAQEFFGIQADLTCLGKILGGGMPLAAFGGPAKIMDQLAPLGPVYQAGTLSGNPVAVAAGLATLAILKNENPYAELEKRTKKFTQQIQNEAEKYGIAITVPTIGSAFTIFFAEEQVCNWEDSKATDKILYAQFFKELLSRAVFFPPSSYEACFLSLAHDDEALTKALKSIGEAFQSLSFATHAAESVNKGSL